MDDVRWAMAQEIPHLRRYARSLTGDDASADDVVQASLERALRKHHLWRRRGSLRSWLFRIVHRTFLNSLPRRPPDRGLDELGDAEPAVPAVQETRSELDATVRDLYRLPVAQRATLALVVVEGLDYEEAADVLGVPVGTVRSRLSRARDTLRQWAEPGDAGDSGSREPYLRRVK
ncbi:MAG: sigma-70 family RNA polymerase sigma factor [Pseudomonadota bacterium]